MEYNSWSMHLSYIAVTYVESVEAHRRWKPSCGYILLVYRKCGWLFQRVLGVNKKAALVWHSTDFACPTEHPSPFLTKLFHSLSIPFFQDDYTPFPEQMDLRNNPFHCDCCMLSLHNMTRTLPTGVTLLLSPAPCASPPALVGVPWENINSTDLCPYGEGAKYRSGLEIFENT